MKKIVFQGQTVTGDSKLSAFPKNDELNQFNSLRCNGLDEVVENSTVFLYVLNY